MQEQKWDKWEYLKHKAKLAGIVVDDNGTNVEFRTEEDGIAMIGLFWKQLDPGAKGDPHEPAADWLKQRGVNLPGWEQWDSTEPDYNNPWDLRNPNGYWHD